ncbi:uncharacterized protein LOC117333197 isoform X1 [Pecten maximus]|uniref:uncharacterized protein LOC117333197 isoform X1 n=1 Tax=Pecten maximus TaxID=6579 RepID=UPI00145850F4|nr:uncharacterized protein LOC117333197 isoform X1 [Pecten maximus]XP_033748262.1 uncharacterized protein LOC117333197 isoform X1 [Pecten maximus]XP_033748263.1 uncharacterized protein LOC117333197 isoform X1 [Pecten maximus]
MITTMKYSSALMVTSVAAMVVVVCCMSIRYSDKVPNHIKPTGEQGTQIRMEVQRQQIQIEQLNQEVKDMKLKLNKLSRPISTQNLIQRTKTKISQDQIQQNKQRQLIDSYDKIPVKVYSIKDGEWTRIPELCQNIASFQSVRLNTMSGVLEVYIHDPKNDKWVSGSLAKGQIWESQLVNLVLAALQKEKNAVFLDIGANLGIYSLMAAKQGFRTVSIEPLKINVQRICSSVRAGHFSDKMTIVRGALSDVSQNVTLGMDVNNVGGSFVLQDQNQIKVKASEVGGTYSDVVMSTTLDNLLQLPDINSTRVVIKMDVEGYEHKVLRGGEKFFNRMDVPTILMEWEFHKGTQSGTEIIQFFESRNYTAYDPIRSNSLHSESSTTWPYEIVWRKIL